MPINTSFKLPTPSDILNGSDIIVPYSIATQTGATQTGATTGASGSIGIQAVAALPTIPAGGTILTVGIGKQFATIAAACAAAHDGATILVSAGTYTNDFATITSKVTLIGVGGMVNMVATIPPPNAKGIILVDNSATIINFSFSGSAISDANGGNGAGIRYEGGDLVLKNDSFIHNQDGLLGAPVLNLASNTITLDHCTFDQNGSGTGYTHNLYVGAVSSLVVTNSIFAEANVGHELKSRALSNTITNNLFLDGPTGTASYDIDLPNGGADVVTNNTIEKGPMAQNGAMVHFGGEGIPYAGSSLLLQGNAFINDMGASALGVLNQTAITATITTNSFTGLDASRLVQGPATLTTNTDGTGTAFANAALVGVLPGSTQIYTDSAAHSIVLQGGTIQAVQGGAGLLTATAIAGHVTVIGGSGGLIYTEQGSSGGNSITTKAGSTNSITTLGQDSIDSEGLDTITAGAGNISAVINGSATITDSSGTGTWSINGTARITAVAGNEFISLGSSATLSVTGSETYLQINSNGGTATYDVTQGGAHFAGGFKGGSFTAKLYSSALQVTTGGGGQGVQMQLTSGDANVTSLGADVITLGSGRNTVITSGAAAIYAGTGALSVFGRGNTVGADVYAAGGTITLDGDTGNITYHGGAAANTVISKLSQDTLIGGAGLMTIIGGSRETIRGGSGGIVLTAGAGTGANTISTLAGSTNVITIAGTNTITSAGQDSITIDGSLSGTITGNAVINAGTSSLALTLSGTDTVSGTGRGALTATSGATVTANLGGFGTVTETGAKVIYTATGPAAATATITGGQATITSQAGSGIQIQTKAGLSTAVTLGTGTATVTTAGADLVHTGSGTATVTVTGNKAEIWAGTGATTVHDYDWTAGDIVTLHGGAGSVLYDQGPGTLNFIGGSGTASIDGGYGALTIQGGSGALAIKGGSLGLHYTGGSGTATIALTSGGGALTFGAGATTVTEAGWGAADLYTLTGGHAAARDLIVGFRAGTDKISLSGVTLTSQAVVSGSATLGFSDGSQLVLQGVANLSHLF